MRLVVKGNLVDFETPVCMTREQRERLLAFLHDTLGHVEQIAVAEPDKEFGSREISWKKWSADDVLELFGQKDEDELAHALGRTRMSVRMARGYMLADVTAWAKRHGKEFRIDKRLIEEYLKETRK